MDTTITQDLSKIADKTFGKPGIWIDFSPGDTHEGTVGCAGMRERQCRVIHTQIIHSDDVEVQGARTPVHLPQAIVAGLDVLTDCLNLQRIQVRCDEGNGIEEGSLLGSAHRIRLVHG